MSEKMIEYARRIAQYQEYPVLIGGLQPLEDYQVSGEMKPGLETKLERECLELREAFALWQQGKGDEWDVMYEIADVYYYSCQIEEQSGRPRWQAMYQGIKHYLPAQWGRREAEAAGEAKFVWRAAAPGNKNKEHEKELIRTAIEALPRRGRPPVHGEPQIQTRIRVGFTEVRILKAIGEEEEESIGEVLVRLASEHPLFKEYQSKVQ